VVARWGGRPLGRPTKWAIKVADGSIVRATVLRNRGIRKVGWRADSLSVYLFVLGC
jgi:hypothetical protein